MLLNTSKYLQKILLFFYFYSFLLRSYAQILYYSLLFWWKDFYRNLSLERISIFSMLSSRFLSIFASTQSKWEIYLGTEIGCQIFGNEKALFLWFGGGWLALVSAVSAVFSIVVAIVVDVLLTNKNRNDRGESQAQRPLSVSEVETPLWQGTDKALPTTAGKVSSATSLDGHDDLCLPAPTLHLGNHAKNFDGLSATAVGVIGPPLKHSVSVQEWLFNRADRQRKKCPVVVSVRTIVVAATSSAIRL